MKLNIPKERLTLAHYQLRAWGEHMRMAWAVDNGMQKASFYKTYGSLSDFREEDMAKLVEFMQGVRLSHNELYKVAITTYKEQVPPEGEPCEISRRRARDRLRRLKSMVVQEVYPAMLARHSDKQLEKLSCAGM